MELSLHRVAKWSTSTSLNAEKVDREQSFVGTVIDVGCAGEGYGRPRQSGSQFDLHCPRFDSDLFQAFTTRNQQLGQQKLS